MIRFSCPNCQVVFKASDDKVGTRAVCPKCRAGFTVPDPRPTALWKPSGTVLAEGLVPPPVRRPAGASPVPREPLAPVPALPAAPRWPRWLWAVPAVGVAGCLVALAAFLGTRGEGARPTAEKPGAGPLLAGLASSAGDRAAVLGHPFWRVRLTETDLDRLLAAVRDQQRGNYLWVDDHARTAVMGDGARGTGIVLKPDSMGPRSFYIDTERWSHRPDEAEVLRELRARLDLADFSAPKD